ncbi:hypothetical protein RFI_15915 [Reticulomyxa filosa]|uniref:Uncharacterized protein n=1 Tax=Reticulomyxa filosa TaxID=46433 RepID=X6N6A2_RETFI|nr:hypothetical protein RFI_15915 [Reticulomyxa filosa]|eukprot:ETO21289.1 hypothetical protein RFI_15915 [Reticulomyxa filosa]
MYGRLDRMIMDSVAMAMFVFTGTLFLFFFSVYLPNYACSTKVNSTLDIPKQIPFFHDNNIKVQQISAGLYHNAVLSSNGEIYTWGCGKFGQIGNGFTADALEPVHINAQFGEDKFVTVKCGSFHTVALTSSGCVYCWGKNNRLQCLKALSDIILTPRSIIHDIDIALHHHQKKSNTVVADIFAGTFCMSFYLKV